MPPEDVLLMMAQLGVAIAGFSGVASALQLSERRTVRRSLLTSILVVSAASVVVWSVVPLVLLTTGIATPRVWQVASLGWAVWQLTILIYRRQQVRAAGFDLPLTLRFVVTLVSFAIALQLWNVLLSGDAWPHLVGVSTSLLVAITTFFILVHEDEWST